MADVQTLYIHDNGGKSFKVTWEPNMTVKIYAHADSWKKHEQFMHDPTYQYHADYDCFFYSEPSAVIEAVKAVHVRERATALLECHNGKLYCVHSSVDCIQMEEGEQLTQFDSPIWANDVTYPWILTNRYVYVIHEKVKLPIVVWNTVCCTLGGSINSLNPYNVLYGPPGHGWCLSDSDVDGILQIITGERAHRNNLAVTLKEAYKSFKTYLYSFKDPEAFVEIVPRP